jgi:glycerol dehydrogenase
VTATGAITGAPPAAGAGQAGKAGQSGGLRLFGGPGRYHQGPGALDLLGEVAAPFGPAPLVIGDAHVMAMLRPRLEALLAGAGLRPAFRTLEGEITRPAIAALARGAEAASVVVGVGGGKSLDAAKGVAMTLGAPAVTVPTIASNDSPTSAAVAIYDDDHVMIAVDRMAASPACVLVDTALIAAAPAHFLRAGIGDAIAKKYEAEGCMAGTGVTPFGTRPLLTALAIADCAHATILRHAEAALAACEAKAVTPDLEHVVEAVVLMSGLGFENGGLSLAHSLTRGLVRARGARDAIHGAQVAWAVLVHMAAEGRGDDDIQSLARFYRRIGLPVRLADLGMADPTDAEIDEMARLTMTAPHLANFGVPLDRAAVAAAIRRAEALGAAA